jgi:propanediol dehydratase small subunit
VSRELVEVPPVNLDARVVYLPVRHHSPACAWYVQQVIETLRPDAVLVEGPRDALQLLPFLADERTRPPVAIYTTYREQRPDEPPRHHAAYYPLCAYSPEWVAVRSASAVGAKVRFIDLAYPEMVRAGRSDDKRASSLQSEAHLRHSAFLQAAAERTGTRDPDDLWDHLFEANYRQRTPQDFFHGVLAYCACARAGEGESALAAEGSHAREACMAAAVAEAEGRVVVVTGGIHAVALPTTEPQTPKALELGPGEQSGVTLMRYRFDQLDHLNGYASGMPLPELYQRLWDGAGADDILVRLARELRAAGAEPSPAETITAVVQMKQLARLRGHHLPTREDLLDAVRSCFIKGSADIEGIQVMARVRRFLAGDRRGEVPVDAGRPPLVLDFEHEAESLRLQLDGSQERELVLDLYRSARHRRTSRLLHSVALLEVRFAQRVRGPDFVRGSDLERIQEVWRYQWHPGTESGLIEASRWGGTVKEATTACLIQRFSQAEAQDGRADVAAALVSEAARCGLHSRLAELVARTGTLIQADPSFTSVAHAAERLVLADRSCEPLELHGDADLLMAAGQAWQRATFLLPLLADCPEEDEAEAIEALRTWRQVCEALGEAAATREQRATALEQLTSHHYGNPACAGAAAGLLHGDGLWDDDDITRATCGRLLGTADPVRGARFLAGLLHTARSCCWQAGGLLGGLDQVLSSCDEDVFVLMLPHLRLAFADLTPRETDRVARLVAGLAGRPGWHPDSAAAVTSGELLVAREVERLLQSRLERDGLEDFLDG